MPGFPDYGPGRAARPTPRQTRWSTVLAAVDVAGPAGPKPAARRIVRVARALASGAGAELHVLHAWSMVGESILACPIRGVAPERLRMIRRGVARVWRARLDEVCDETLDGVDHRRHVVKGDPRRVVPRVIDAVGADLVVLGVPSRSVASRLLCSTLLDCIAGRADCDVIALHKPNEDDPEPIDAYDGRLGRGLWR